MTPSRKALQSLLEACRIRLGPDALDQLWHYHRLLREADAELNLTRIRNFENMVLKHYADSLLVLRYADLPSPLIDMGSGPGLPGIPLKIARPDIAMILAEPRAARAEFLEHVVAELGLPNVEVFAGKVNSRFPRRARGVITRAVATIPETLELVTRVIEPGGRMLFMKGPGCDDEIAQARQLTSFRLDLDQAYAIPGTTHDRRLVVYERLRVPTDPTTPDDGQTESSSRSPSASPYAGVVREVSSAANPTMKLARDLLTGRGVRKHGKALIAGAKVVAEVLDRFPDRVLAWIAPVKGDPPPVDGLTWLRLADPLFREIDVSGTRSPLLLVSVPNFAPWSPADPWPDGCTLLVPFQDPENVGAVIRSAAAFGVPRVVLLREAAHPFHPRAVRAAGTSLFQVELLEGPSIRDLAPASGPSTDADADADADPPPIYTLDADGQPLPDTAFPPRFGLLAGVEGPGLPAALRAAPTTLRIPIAPGVESLNAAVAVSVALYAWSSRRGG